MYLRSICLSFFCLSIATIHCDGLDDLVKGLSGSDDDSGNNDDRQGETLAFISSVKMVDGDRAFWDTGGFTQFSDGVGDADSSNNYGDIDEVRIAHNANNMFVEISRDDGDWDFTQDQVRMEVRTSGDDYTVFIDFNGTYEVLLNGDPTCNNDSQEILEGVHDGNVLLGKFPLNQSENAVNCFNDEVIEIDRVVVAIENTADQCNQVECDRMEIDSVLRLDVPEDSIQDIQEMDGVVQFNSTLGTIDDNSANFVDSITNTAILEDGDISRIIMAHNPNFEELYIGFEIRGESNPTSMDFLISIFTEGDTFRIKNNSASTPEIFVNDDSGAVCQAGDLGFTAPTPDPTSSGTYAFAMEFLLDDCLPGIDGDTIIESFSIVSSDSSDLELDTYDARRLSLNP